MIRRLGELAPYLEELESVSSSNEEGLCLVDGLDLVLEGVEAGELEAPLDKLLLGLGRVLVLQNSGKDCLRQLMGSQSGDSAPDS